MTRAGISQLCYAEQIPEVSKLQIRFHNFLRCISEDLKIRLINSCKTFRIVSKYCKHKKFCFDAGVSLWLGLADSPSLTGFQLFLLPNTKVSGSTELVLVSGFILLLRFWAFACADQLFPFLLFSLSPILLVSTWRSPPSGDFFWHLIHTPTPAKTNRVHSLFVHYGTYHVSLKLSVFLF